jgi:hypothetical protein
MLKLSQQEKEFNTKYKIEYDPSGFPVKIAWSYLLETEDKEIKRIIKIARQASELLADNTPSREWVGFRPSDPKMRYHELITEIRNLNRISKKRKKQSPTLNSLNKLRYPFSPYIVRRENKEFPQYCILTCDPEIINRQHDIWIFGLAYLVARAAKELDT